MVGSVVLHGFVENLIGFPLVKEFWKSVKSWQSYRHEFGVLLFWDTVYISITNQEKNLRRGKIKKKQQI